MLLIFYLQRIVQDNSQDVVKFGSEHIRNDSRACFLNPFQDSDA